MRNLFSVLATSLHRTVVVRSKVVVLLLVILLFIVVSIVCGGSVFGPCFVIYYFVSF